MLSNKTKKVVIFVGAIFWSLFAAEMFLKIMKPQPIMPRYVQAGEFGIRVNVPNKTYFHKTADYKVLISTNSKGLRAEEDIPYKNESGKKRIVVLGDSFGMGYGVNLADTFTEKMRRKLESKTDSEYEIINLSVSGYGTAEQLLMLQNEGLKYKPDLVLMTWHRTDARENITSGLFELSDGELLRNKNEYLPAVKQREILNQFFIYRFLSENSQLYYFARNKIAIKIKEFLLTRNIADNKGKELTLDIATKTDPKAVVTEGLPITFALVKKIKQLSLESGADFIILDIPDSYSRTNIISKIPSELLENNIVVQPTATFLTYSGQLLYWENSNGHFTPLGCDIIGNLLAETILNETNFGKNKL